MAEIVFLSEKIAKPQFPDEWYTMAEESHFWIEARLQAFLRQARDLEIRTHEQLKGLEIGCGNGIVRQQLEKNVSWIVEGADINETALQLNPALKGTTYYYDILEQRPEFGNFYDFIILFDVLEHIDREKPFLDAIKFHLKENGYLFINVPASMFLYSKYDQFNGHFRRYDRNSLNTVLASSGLQVLDMRYWAISMVPLLMARKVMLMTKESSEDVTRNGFKPPSRMINAMLRKIMAAERAVCPKPFLGTSLLAAAKKL